MRVYIAVYLDLVLPTRKKFIMSENWLGKFEFLQ